MIIFIIHVMGPSEHLLILIVHLILCNNYILIKKVIKESLFLLHYFCFLNENHISFPNFDPDF